MLCLLVAFPLLFTSCGGDDDSSDDGSGTITQNEFTYEGTNYDISTAIVENFGMYGNNYNFDLSLTDAVITNENGEPTTSETSFTGVYFEMFSENENTLLPGTYTYISELEEDWSAAFSFDYAEIIFINSIDDENYIEILDGTVTIAEDNTFEVSFTGVDEDGNTISGYYKGDTMNFDYEDETGRPATFKTKKRGFLK